MQGVQTMCAQKIATKFSVGWAISIIFELVLSGLSGSICFAELSFPYNRCTPFQPGQYSSSLYIDQLGNPHVAWEQVLNNGISSDGEKCWQNDI
jgi:hypothetical protein